jgi:outer membrane biosynthesis protein TonB
MDCWVSAESGCSAALRALFSFTTDSLRLSASATQTKYKNKEINPMKNTSIIISLLLAIFITGFAFAQEPLQGAEKNLLKPKPLLDQCKMPEYPEMIADSIPQQGRVIVMVTVNDTGQVVSEAIMREYPKGLGFGYAVSKVVKDWNYLPAYWNGKPAPYTVLETFLFNNGKVEYVEREEEPALADSTKKENEMPADSGLPSR